MELLEQFAAGDIQAFEALFREFQGEVYGWIVRMVRDPSAAEDLTIETFWRMYRARARCDPNKNVKGWAHRIATNAALDYLRQRRPETELTWDVAQSSGPDPALESERQEQIRRAFHRLPPKLQVAATLALVEERPYGEIAEALGISVSAVKVRVFRAVRVLRKQLRTMGVHP